MNRLKTFLLLGLHSLYSPRPRSRGRSRTMTTSQVLPICRDTYGALLLMLAAPALVPGIGTITAPLAGFAGLTLGVQLAMGRRVPWMPDRVQSWIASSTLGPKLSLWIQARCQPLLRLPSPRFPMLFAGLTVAWSSLIMLLPLAIVPFSNTIPALSMGLVGTGLVVRKSLFSWLGMALSGGYTALLIIIGEALVLATQGILARLT